MQHEDELSLKDKLAPAINRLFEERSEHLCDVVFADLRPDDVGLSAKDLDEFTSHLDKEKGAFIILLCYSKALINKSHRMYAFPFCLFNFQVLEIKTRLDWLRMVSDLYFSCIFYLSILKL